MEGAEPIDREKGGAYRKGGKRAEPICREEWMHNFKCLNEWRKLAGGKKVCPQCRESYVMC